MNTKLTAENVVRIFQDCLFLEGENTDKHIKAEGITTTAGFNPDRLDKHKKEIEAMLNELPNEFQKSGGGGMSFLNACMDKYGNQWTGFHQTMEQLFQLGIAIGKVQCQLPRKMWTSLPGGMPYYIVN
ncbi:MAG: hypothetical protein Q8P20_05505 [bacterium]|nr:hypothetical protein [bacterium]